MAESINQASTNAGKADSRSRLLNYKRRFLRQKLADGSAPTGSREEGQEVVKRTLQGMVGSIRRRG